MRVVATRAALREARADLPRGRVALVPTMGNLHAGHLQLIASARAQCDHVIATIFVNPTQFGPDEDLATYPRTPGPDQQALTEAGTDLLFMPTVDEMFPSPPAAAAGRAIVHLPGLSTELCGASRPGHFDGVTTIVLRLLQLTQPSAAYFGEKDYQQLTIIRRMVADLDVPVTIHGVPTVREADGLAMSSRNAHLRADDRPRAPALYRVLQQLAANLHAGQRDFAALAATGRAAINRAGLHCDYLEIRAADTLAALPAGANPAAVVIVAAAQLGQPRLIDNLRVELR